MSNGLTSSSKPARKRWLWLACWASMAVATHIPITHTGTRPIANADKFLHAGMYFILTLLGGRYLAATRHPVRRRTLIVWALAYALYGVVDECLQPYVQRTASLADWGADVAGIILATAWLALRSPNIELSEPGAGRAR